MVVSLNAASYSAPRNENQLISAVARGGFAPYVCTPSERITCMLSPYTRGRGRGGRPMKSLTTRAYRGTRRQREHLRVHACGYVERREDWTRGEGGEERRGEYK